MTFIGNSNINGESHQRQIEAVLFTPGNLSLKVLDRDGKDILMSYTIVPYTVKIYPNIRLIQKFTAIDIFFQSTSSICDIDMILKQTAIIDAILKVHVVGVTRSYDSVFNGEAHVKKYRIGLNC